MRRPLKSRVAWGKELLATRTVNALGLLLLFLQLTINVSEAPHQVSRNQGALLRDPAAELFKWLA